LPYEESFSYNFFENGRSFGFPIATASLSFPYENNQAYRRLFCTWPKDFFDHHKVISALAGTSGSRVEGALSMAGDFPSMVIKAAQEGGEVLPLCFPRRVARRARGVSSETDLRL